MALPKREVRRRGAIPNVELINSVTFTPVAGSSNVCEVLITPKNVKGTTTTGPRTLILFLSDAATGAGVTGTTASGAVTVVSTFGTELVVTTAKKVWLAQTNAAGVYKLSITDSAKTGFYVTVVDPMSGKHFVAAQLITANYG